MTFCCCSSSDFLQSHYTVLPSSYPLPFSRAFWWCFSRPLFLRFFRFESFLSQFSLFVAQTKNICDDPCFLLLTMFAKDLTGCFSHCYVALGRIQAMEMSCHLKILRISYKDHVTNEEVRAKYQQEIGPHEDFLNIVKRCKLKWYGHVSRSSILTKTIL